jgi:hypothetical protein
MTAPTSGLLTQSSQKYPTENPCGTVEAPAGSADRLWRRTCSFEVEWSECVTEMASTEETANGSSVRWTEEEVHELSESDTRFLMQMATLRSTPHDLFIIRWCTAHLRNSQDPVDRQHGTES